jgi:alkanesulfonate monooxygenase SsuD/methylene tetrahydromethanopterin reductase-like flavin-dependent oxidoreductase (luciferase family)
MKLGLGPIDLAGISSHDLRALGDQAVASSFDCVWLAESRGAGAGGGLAAAAMMARWVPIRVGALVDVGAYHPLHLAEDIAVADITCAGRLEVMLRPAHGDAEVVEEHLRVLAAALSGAHVQWNGKHLRVPGRLAGNEPVPQRLALNPRPTQPRMPVWLLDARSQGFGVARRWERGMTLGQAWLPEAVLCPGTIEPEELLAAAGDGAGYFIVEAADPDEAEAAGRRLAGPLRMPEFPDWARSG